MAASKRSDGSSTANVAVAEVIPFTQPSERAQAQLFAKMLRREITTLKKKATNAESPWQRHCDSEGYVDPPEHLAVIRGRIAEAKSMLAALNARFPGR